MDECELFFEIPSHNRSSSHSFRITRASRLCPWDLLFGCFGILNRIAWHGSIDRQFCSSDRAVPYLGRLVSLRMLCLMGALLQDLTAKKTEPCFTQ